MKATAFVVGTDTTVASAAGAAGFAEVLPYTGLSQVEERVAATPICYLLFCQVTDVTTLKSVIAQLRGCKRRNVRFSPLIYLCQQPSREAIRGCISLGFDDVISLPLGEGQLAARLGHHLGQPVTYFEAEGYFGPDRRQNEPRQMLHERRSAGTMCQRYEFVRDQDSGIAIISKQLVAA